MSAGLDVVVCAPASGAAAGSVLAGGAAVSCVMGDGTAGQLSVMRLDLMDTGSGGDGSGAGLAIGGAVLGVLAVAWGLRHLRDFIAGSAGE
ncbi:major capsid protein [Burkholderia sp. Ax-1724]|uniref:major capsid protein n=1 Tax=Burkholderia sp. Ax-1724 TaxID=2608336 RepID=UPI001420028E|nr:major capsid protein [Burkholderia sp. Ax-1724]NIF53580.1 hypothetical protein [Burkholderia sp. Ax-1724]